MCYLTMYYVLSMYDFGNVQFCNEAIFIGDNNEEKKVQSLSIGDTEERGLLRQPLILKSKLGSAFKIRLHIQLQNGRSLF